MRILDVTMAALFTFAAVLQFNDPDPMQWIAIYMAAAVLSAAMAFRRRVPSIAIAWTAVIAIVWALLIALRVPSATEYRHMFDAWEMASPSVEDAREVSGLLIVAAWMAVLVLRARRAPVRA